MNSKERCKVMLKDALAKMLLSVGKVGVKLDINTNSPIIHYQPRVPDSINALKKEQTNKKPYR
jgi:cyclic lactone autoinducer peptide